MNTYNIEHNGTMLNQVPFDRLTVQLQMQGLIVSLPHEIQNLSELKQTVYLPVKVEKHKNYHIFDLNECDGSFIQNVAEESGYFFTPEQLNEYTQNVIKQALETAAEKALLKTEYIDEVYDSNFEDTALPNEEIFLRTDGDGIPYAANKVRINKESITNTFEDTYNKFKV